MPYYHLVPVRAGQGSGSWVYCSPSGVALVNPSSPAACQPACQSPCCPCNGSSVPCRAGTSHSRQFPTGLTAPKAGSAPAALGSLGLAPSLLPAAASSPPTATRCWPGKGQGSDSRARAGAEGLPVPGDARLAPFYFTSTSALRAGLAGPCWGSGHTLQFANTSHTSKRKGSMLCQPRPETSKAAGKARGDCRQSHTACHEVWQLQCLGPYPCASCILHVLWPGYSSLLLCGWKNGHNTGYLSSARTFQDILHLGAGTL